MNRSLLIRVAAGHRTGNLLRGSARMVLALHAGVVIFCWRHLLGRTLLSVMVIAVNWAVIGLATKARYNHQGRCGQRRVGEQERQQADDAEGPAKEVFFADARGFHNQGKAYHGQ